MQYGLPVICTNHGATKEIVGDSGIVIDNDIPDDERPKMYGGIQHVVPEKFSEAYKTMMVNLPLYRQKVKERVDTELNEKVCGQKFKELFEYLIKH
jgi:glycosyltransferase involved in cell wall biosynthesis